MGEEILTIKNLDDEFRPGSSSAVLTPASQGLSMGWLLRLFRSDFFDAWMAVSYLYKYRRKRGVLDYLCNELYMMAYEDLEEYLPQICHIIVFHLHGNAMVERFLMDKCSESVHFAMQVFWYLEAALDDAVAANDRRAIEFRKRLKLECETSTVNGPKENSDNVAEIMDQARSNITKALDLSVEESRQESRQVGGNGIARSLSGTFPNMLRSLEADTEFRLNPEDNFADDSNSSFRRSGLSGGPFLAEDTEDTEDNAKLDNTNRSKTVQPRGQSSLWDNLENSQYSGLQVSPRLKVKEELKDIAPILPLYDPALPESVLRSMSSAQLAQKISILCQKAGGPDTEAETIKLLTVKQERCDYFLQASQLMKDLAKISYSLMPVPEAQRKSRLKRDLLGVNATVVKWMARDLNEATVKAVVKAGPEAYLRGPHIPLIRAKETALRLLRTLPEECVVLTTKARVPYMLFVEVAHSELINCDGNLFCEHLVADQLRYRKRRPRGRLSEEGQNPARKDLLRKVFGELWEDKERRILAESPFLGIPNREIYAFIVKANDDLRQDQLAVQMIKAFDSIFKKENVKTSLRPYTIICMNSDTGLVELVPNAVSVSTVKKKTPGFKSLRDFFERAFGPVNSGRWQSALTGFIQSMAGYSLVSYFMQIKDRHNGNILIDSHGHITHVDFGFMLSNHPGIVNFETAPFKLSPEYVEVMGGSKSRGYKEFREIFIEGFLAARKHHEIFTTLVEIMVEGTKMPCMKGGKALVDSLRRRFFLGIPEKEVIAKINGLIDESYHNWRTTQYDKFQYMTNGVL